MSKTSTLAATVVAFAGIAAAAPKRASILGLREDHPNIDPRLQALIGDPNGGNNSIFGQTSPEVGENLLANPMSPTQGDEIFFTGLMPGSRFQSHDGQWWDIEEYDFEDKILVRNTWYPWRSVITSVDVIRKSIHSWIEPFTQTVPPPPSGTDYGVLDVRVVE